LQLVGGSAVAAPGASGRRLNVEAGAAPVLQALADGAQSVALTPESVPPMRAEPEPAYRKAQALLAQQFTLVAADPLTGEPPAGYHAEFTAPPDRIAAWLEPRPEQADIKLYINTAAVRAWLQEIAPQVGDSRTLSVDETLRPVVAALYAGEHRAEARIRHPEGVYVVQPGDNFYDIAYSLGFPQWQLERANPDVDPGVIDVGQVLTVPSLDVLFPYSLAPGKRIEIDLPTQTLRAYENDRQVFEFKVSSGISSTPTIAGQFQVLFKEENALAQRWSLDMPYFMAIYEEGEDYYNGIHELPITSYGTRLSAGVLGWPASYGCIIVDVGAAEALYNWAPMGTLVRITGVAPGTPTWQETLADIAPPTTDQ
jgi:LysM repeat protein